MKMRGTLLGEVVYGRWVLILPALNIIQDRPCSRIVRMREEMRLQVPNGFLPNPRASVQKRNHEIVLWLMGLRSLDLCQRGRIEDAKHRK